MRDEKLQWREAHFKVIMLKTPHAWSTLGSWGFSKSARRCGAKHIWKSKWHKKPCSEHFWNSRCSKTARPCGAKHTAKSKRAKRLRSGALLEVEMFRKRTPLWREAHLEVKTVKAQYLRTSFGRSSVTFGGRLHFKCNYNYKHITLHYIYNYGNDI